MEDAIIVFKGVYFPDGLSMHMRNLVEARRCPGGSKMSLAGRLTPPSTSQRSIMPNRLFSVQKLYSEETV
jgi:hypothetical protein